MVSEDPARTLSGVPRDITVCEAHYGQRPNVESFA